MGLVFARACIRFSGDRAWEHLLELDVSKNVFFSSLGHAEKTWSNEQFLRFLIPALQYATGDYIVDDSVE